jgi:hypothetical protein
MPERLPIHFLGLPPGKKLAEKKGRRLKPPVGQPASTPPQHLQFAHYPTPCAFPPAPAGFIRKAKQRTPAATTIPAFCFYVSSFDVQKNQLLLDQPQKMMA